MPDLCGYLVTLLVVLGLVTLVGHGLWVMLAAILRPLSGQGAQRPATSRRCPECGSRAVSLGGHCLDCGAMVTGEEAEPAADEWSAAARELKRLHSRGLLGADRFREMLAALREERSRVLRERSEPKEAAKEFWSELSKEAEPAVEPATVAEEPAEILDFVEPAAVSAEAGAARPEVSPEPVVPAQHPPVAAAEGKRDWGRLLQAFMEEKNIRWGELVSGMLIVGSAIGLVISLWSTLQNTIPYFPALLFMTGTAAVHGAGLYTLKRWNLKSTSRGLLVISTLLIPLNFLAAITLSGQPGSPNYVEAADPVYFAAVAVGLLCYGAIAYSSGRIFRKRHWWVLWPTVMLPCIGQLVIARQAGPEMSAGWVNLMAGTPLAGFVVAIAAQLQVAGGGRRFSQRRCEQTFQVLGIGGFSLLIALGLLVSKSGDWRDTLADLAPPASAISVLLTATGLLVHSRATRPELAGYRTAGTAVSLTGASLMLAALALAWPRPELLIAAGLVDAAALTWLALSARLPVLHVPAIAAAALTALTGLHWAQGTIEAGGGASGTALLDALLMGRSSLLLLGLSVASLAGSAGWAAVAARRSSSREPGADARTAGLETDAGAYLWGSAGMALLSLAVAFVAGFLIDVDRPLTTPVFAVAAVALLGACFVPAVPAQAKKWTAWSGAVMLFVALLHATAWNETVIEFLGRLSLLPRDPAILSALCTATLTGLLALPGFPSQAAEPNRPAPYRTALCGAAFAASALVLPAVLLEHGGAYGTHAGYLFWTAALWGGSAATLRSRGLAVAAQALSFLAVGFAAVFLTQRQTWWQWRENFADPRYWQVQLALQAAWCVAWNAVRRLVPRTSTAARLLGWRKWNVDHAVLAATLIGAVALGTIGVLPGITAELQIVSATHVGGAHRAGFEAGLPDVLAAVALCGLFVGALFTVSWCVSRRLFMPLFGAGLVAVWVMASQATTVTAEGFRFAAGVSHASAHGVGTWVVAAVVLAGLCLTLWERFSTLVLCALIVLGGLVPVLIAGGTETRFFVATTLRWGLAIVAVLLTAGFSFCRTAFRTFRDGLETRPAEISPEMPDVLEAARATGYACTLWPVLALTLHTALYVAGGNAVAGMPAEMHFLKLDFGLSYSVPVWLFAGALLVSAVRNRDDRFGISASLLIQFGMLLLFALPHWQLAGNLGGAGLVEWLQWSGIGLGACTLLWSAGNVWDEARTRRPAGGEGLSNHPGQVGKPSHSQSVPFAVQVGWTAATAGLLSLWGAVAIVAAPTGYEAVVRQLGHGLGFAAFGLAVAAVFVALLDERRAVASRNQEGLRRSSSSGTRVERWLWGAVGLLSLVPLLAAASPRLERWIELTDTWLTYHALIAGWGAVMAALTVAGVVTRSPEPASDGGEGSAGVADRREQHAREALMLFALLLGAVLVLLGVRAQWADPQRPWWLVGTASAAAAVCAAFGLRRRSQHFAYASGGLVLLATIAALSKPWIGLAPSPVLGTWLRVFQASLVAVAGVGLFWLAVELFWQRRRNEDFDPAVQLPVQHTAAGVGTLLATIFAVWLLFARELAAQAVVDQLPLLTAPLGWSVLLTTAALLFASLWDRRALHALPCLFVMGLVVCVAVLDAVNAGVIFEDLNVELPHVWFGLEMIAAGYVALTAGAWSARRPLANAARRFRAAEEIIASPLTAVWLSTAVLGLAGFAVAVGYWSVLWFDEPSLRYAAGAATAVLVPGLALFGVEDQRERPVGPATFRFLSLLALLLSAVQIAWAVPIAPAVPDVGLERAIRLLEVTAGATLLFAAVLFRGRWTESWLRPGWRSAFRQLSATSGGAAILSLAVVLAMEAALFAPGVGVTISNVQAGAVAGILVALSAGLILLAVIPGRDAGEPSQSAPASAPAKTLRDGIASWLNSERFRMLCVYASELVLSLLFLHVYLTRPKWFSGYFFPWWPYIVIGIAYAGVGIGELCRRSRLPVLAEPLQRTGTLLPLLPALAFWVAMTSLGFDEYSLVLFLVGLMYVVLATWRKSFWYALAAAFVGNMALWSLFAFYDSSLWQRPQLWLIPPALSLLTAGQLNRKRLSEAQLTAIRYFSMFVIYASSTGEMFIVGVGTHLLHPVILAALSVAGILSGMLLRIRAFLYLGTSFLFLSIVSMVWHAAQIIDDVWPWWVFGIVLGLAMLALFGLFEKKRNEVLGALNRLKEWEP